MTATPPHIDVLPDPEGAWLRLHGSWTAPVLAPFLRAPPWQATLAQYPAHARWDVRGVERLDHTGAQLLWNAWAHQWPAQLQALPGQRAMLERVARFTVVPPKPPSRPWRDGWMALGDKVLALGEHAVHAVRLLGQLVLDVARLVRHPTRGPWRDVSGHLYRVGATALPITALVGFLIGVVLAYLMAQQLRQLGADAFIVNILGLALVRELGPMLAAILVAGRSGSAITAQIGVMRVNEELDAMRVMGIAKGFRLVLPRALALALAMPLLAVWTMLAALLGGLVAADVSLGLTPAYFLNTLPKVVPLVNVGLACAKAMVFGLLIALIACHFGLRVQPNTQSLGAGTTASVVTSITMVILVDALFAVLFKDIGL